MTGMLQHDTVIYFDILIIADKNYADQCASIQNIGYIAT